MQIDDTISNYKSILNSDSARYAGGTKTDVSHNTKAETQSLKVDISAAALQKSEDETRLERLNAIRQQLAEGTYNISGKDVANKILKVLKS